MTTSPTAEYRGTRVVSPSINLASAVAHSDTTYKSQQTKQKAFQDQVYRNLKRG